METDATAIKEQIKDNEKLKVFLQSLKEEYQVMANMIIIAGYLHRRVSDYEEEGNKDELEACRCMADKASKLTKMVAEKAGIPEEKLREIERGVYRCLDLQKDLYIF